MKLRIAAVLVPVLLAACAPQAEVMRKPLPHSVVVETVETDADRLLEYYAFMTELQGEPLLREYQRVRKAFWADPNDFNRMQMIMLLSSSSATFRDIRLAHSLLKEWLADQYNTYSKLRSLALLYDNYLAELIRLEAARNQASDQLRQASDRVERQSERIEQQKTEIAMEKQRSGELQNKLDALLEMEKALIEREQMTTPDKP